MTTALSETTTWWCPLVLHLVFFSSPAGEDSTHRAPCSDFISLSVFLWSSLLNKTKQMSVFFPGCPESNTGFSAHLYVQAQSPLCIHRKTNAWIYPIHSIKMQCIPLWVQGKIILKRFIFLIQVRNKQANKIQVISGNNHSVKVISRAMGKPQGLANIFHKGFDSKYFAICGPVLVATQVPGCNTKAATDRM